jgi:hypothetical protein
MRTAFFAWRYFHCARFEAMAFYLQKENWPFWLT